MNLNYFSLTFVEKGKEDDRRILSAATWKQTSKKQATVEGTADETDSGLECLS